MSRQVGASVIWFDHYDKGHDVGMRHEDGLLYSATCHDCDVVYNLESLPVGAVLDPVEPGGQQ